MVKGRMLEIVRYLENERMASYKEIAGVLDMKERTVRYDVDCINNELSLKKAPLIEKYPKGMLFVPDDLDFSVIVEDEEFVFTPEERREIVRMWILFRTEKLNLRALSEKMQVSRRSIQNDVESVSQELQKDGLTLEYEKGFHLHGESEKSYGRRSSELVKNIKFLDPEKRRSAYGKYIGQMLEEMLLPVELEKLTEWVSRYSELMNWVFSDESYQWYVANVITFTWYLIQEKELPQTEWEEKYETGQGIKRYEAITGRQLSEREKGILAGFAKYTKKYVNLDVNLDLVKTEDIAMDLVKKMERSLQIQFSKDGILLKGLLNHIGPMLERLKSGVLLQEEAVSLIPEEYDYVYRALKEIMKEDEILSSLTENEEVYLVIFFLGSIRRMQQAHYKNVLLVCGFGYGTTAVVKDALLNGYQVYIRESIPAYRVKTYEKWDEIDIVLSTVPLDLPVKKPFAQLHVIFQKEDYVKLDLLGIQRKNVLTNYFAIERRLDFLSKEDRQRTMDVIKEELGYKEVRMPAKYYKLTDLLEREDVRCISGAESWKQAVEYSTGILIEHGKIQSSYCQNIIQGIEMQGFYSVTDNAFALLHGNETAGVNISCMSLIISEEPVRFGEKKVNIIFCLASRDKKEHVPAIIRLMRMVAATGFIEELKKCTTTDQAWNVIETCEKEVESCYQL
nr:PTS sugar transporter subunit IIA [uncultured Mediterraneibacter sp.]